MNMSPVKTKDPKNYVQPKPLPFASHQGLRIQARSDTHYNCETPGREEVFLDNYARRQRQRSEQGYNSANYRPYQVLGDQMHLDEKKLILQGLGQLDEVSALLHGGGHQIRATEIMMFSGPYVLCDSPPLR